MNEHAATDRRLVWDLPLRLFHWLLVFNLLGLWLTAEVLDDGMVWHSYLGYTMLGLLCFRLIWGMVGPTHARFASFVRGPTAIKHYVANLFKDTHKPVPGHNPIGGLMVIFTLFLLVTQTVSGLFMTDDVIFNGPYFRAVSAQAQSTMNWLHHNVITVIWAMALIHIAVIVLYHLKLRINLVGPMFSGKKRVTKEQAIPHSRILLAIAIIVLVSVLIYLIVAVWPPEQAIEDFDY